MDNQKDTLTEDATAGLPFHDFFVLLKNNGFSVTTQQIIDAHKVIINYSNSLKNEEELCLYLLPVFTGNEDEQVLFKKLFHKYFSAYQGQVTQQATKKQDLTNRIKRNWKKILLLYGLLALLLVAMIVLIYQEYTRPRPETISITLVSPNRSIMFNRNSFSVTPNQLLTLNTVCADERKKVRRDVTLTTTFNWGDGSATENKNAHAYKLQGKFELNVFVEVSYKGSFIKFDTIRCIVLVCAEQKSLQVDHGGETNIRMGEKVILKATVNSNDQPLYIKWYSADKDLFYGNTYTTSFSKAGTHSISCLAVYDSINSPCSMRKDIMFTVIDPKADTKIVSDSTENAPATNFEVVRKTAAPFLVPMYLAMAIVFGLLAILFLVLSEKQKINIGNVKKAVLDKYNKLSHAFSGKKTPAVIPFRNKNYVPVHQSEINYAARQMRKRVNDHSRFLHLGKTISRSIENNGLFQPVLLPRTRQTEYLVLIDETNPNSQLVKLFEYLAQELKKQNILIEKYYYRKEPKLCYRFNETGSISLEKLFTRHENHILLIFGDAHQLIDKKQPVFNSEYMVLLNRWQHKAIVTPVSFADWETKEKTILMPHVPVFPVDMEGLLLMSEYLSDDEHSSDITARLNQHRSLFYKVQGYHFETIKGLEVYCNQAKWAIRKDYRHSVNILFQWIAALAVYPKISWEVTIAIGKSILDRYDCGNELNFTNLLRIVRISWMQEGRFPDAIRFELLKRLDTENEKLARETMLELLKEIPAGEIKESSMAFEEKEVQQIINEFSLYANDPSYYTTYKESKGLFEKLWKDKKLNDPVTEQYFNNTGQDWKTTINATTTDDSITNVGVAEYFETNEKQDTILSKLYLWLCLISVFVFVASLFALIILYKWKTGTDRDPNELAYIQDVLSNML